MLALAAQRLLRLALTLLALVDEHGETLALLREHEEVARELVAFLRDLLAQANELAEIGGKNFSLLAHFGQHRPQHHGGAHGLERVLGADEERGRGFAADALQRRQELGDEVAALLQRAAQRLLALVERLDARLGFCDSVLDGGNARGRFDDLLVELAPIVAHELDLALELRLLFQGLALLGAQRLELLVALLEAVETRGRCGRAVCSAARTDQATGAPGRKPPSARSPAWRTSPQACGP